MDPHVGPIFWVHCNLLLSLFLLSLLLLFSYEINIKRLGRGCWIPMWDPSCGCTGVIWGHRDKKAVYSRMYFQSTKILHIHVQSINS